MVSMQHTFELMASLVVPQDMLDEATEALFAVADAVDAPLLDERIARDAPDALEMAEAVIAVAVPLSAAEARDAWLKLDEGRAKLDRLTKLDWRDASDDPLGAEYVSKAANRAVLALDALAGAREKQTSLLAMSDERAKANDGND